MDDNNLSPATLDAIKVLEYWHKIEFFESTDIKDLEDNAEGVLTLEQEDLLSPVSLPWIDPAMVRLAGNNFSPDKAYCYELFFGIFGRDEIFARAKSILSTATITNEENIRDEGRTCSIKCIVDQDGTIKIDSFEFSTVTWALGKLQSGGLDNLHFDTYQEATKKLHDNFSKIVSVANNIKKQLKQPLKLSTYEIIEFLKAMEQWTCFTPKKTAPALFIKLKEAKQNNKEEGKNHSYHPGHIADLTKVAELIVQPVTEPCAKISSDISILNSFYIRDIETTLTYLKKFGLDPLSPLGQYLTGSRVKKADLLLPAGRTLLLEKLRLNQLPAGRWPSDSQHNMSLMQQFAINTLEHELELSGLYSVNGPPGTGKTTMLRDIIASNLVKRAAVLSDLEQVSDAFEGSITEEIMGQQRTIPCLSARLSGFEMVVASSNNAAVENISRELPQINSLGEAWQDIDYFKPVAQKLAATTQPIKKPYQQDGKSFKINPLTEKNNCWGLIAAALGKQDNRDIFGNRIFFQKHENAMALAPADSYRNIYSVLKQKPTKSFSEAKKAFKMARDHLDTIHEELKKLEHLNDLRNDLALLTQKIDNVLHRKNQLVLFHSRRQEKVPKWWTLKLQKICRELSITVGLGRRLSTVEAKAIMLKTRLDEMLTNIELHETQCKPLMEKYSDVIFPSMNTSLEDKKIQCTTFGHGKKLNEARSVLTIRALELHQVWIMTAYRECDLKFTFFGLMSAINGSFKNKQSTQVFWQLLFMLVPVISTTFASLARQFSSFSSSDIGWLFIDEAGQATPQQAVGALFRTKRAVIVGDPLQIEPVFTIPPAFVEAIAQRDLGDSWKDWSPTLQSVQNLADRVNPYGTMQISKDNWLGSPLRVHRRCDEPMFSISNTIAYNNKMLHGKAQLCPQDKFLWGGSCWFDVAGETDGKHYVPEQGLHVLSMIKSWLQQNNQTLPDVYIITPFKQIKNKLKALLKEELCEVKDINQWLNKCIGTVHTFQGKEEKNVIIVLGLSDKTKGAAKWASDKPNLLNVAVTRAQKRIYIIGSKDIWSECPYFNIADDKLPNAV